MYLSHFNATYQWSTKLHTSRSQPLGSTSLTSMTHHRTIFLLEDTFGTWSTLSILSMWEEFFDEDCHRLW